MNGNHKMPVLDTQIWVDFERREKSVPEEMGQAKSVLKVGNLKKIILFKFHKKPMANPCPNMKRSGLPEGTKCATLRAEIHRRLRSTSIELGSDRITEILYSIWES